MKLAMGTEVNQTLKYRRNERLGGAKSPTVSKLEGSPPPIVRGVCPGILVVDAHVSWLSRYASYGSEGHHRCSHHDVPSEQWARKATSYVTFVFLFTSRFACRFTKYLI
jgi:hypothetical protein